MDEKELQALYNAMSKQFDVGDWNTFRGKMTTTDDRKRFYDAVSKNGFDLGDYNTYEQRIGGVKKKQPTESLWKRSISGGQTGQSQTASAASQIGGQAGASAIPSTKSQTNIPGYNPLETEVQRTVKRNKEREKEQIVSYVNKTYPKLKQTDEQIIEGQQGRAYAIGRQKLDELIATPEGRQDPVANVKSAQQTIKDNPQEWVKNYLAGRYMEDEVDGVDAGELLGANFFPGDKTSNQTVKLLSDKKDKYLSETENLRSMAAELDANGNAIFIEGRTPEAYEFDAVPRLEQAAFKWRLKTDKNFADEVKVTGRNNFDNIPSYKRGETMEMFLNSPEVATYIRKENPDMIPAFDAAAKGLLSKNTDYGINVVANEISRKRQEEGLNNPIVEFDDRNFRNETDMVADILYANDPQKKAIYDKYIKPDPDQYIDTPSLLEGFAQGGEGVLKGVKNTFQEPFRSASQSLLNSWDKEARNISADPKGFSKISHGTGHVFGLVATLGGLSKVIGAGGTGTYSKNVAPILSGGVLPFFGDMLEEGRKKYPTSPVKAWLSGGINTTMYAALSKQIFPAAKIEQAIKGVQPEVKNIVERLASGEITREVARQESNTAFKKAWDFVKGTVGGSAKISGELTAITAANRGFDKLMMDEDQFDLYHDDNELGETFKTNLLNNIGIAGVSKFGEQKKSNRIAKEAYYEIASNPKMYDRIINNLSVDKSFGTVNELKSNLDHIVKLKEQLNREGVSPEAQKEFIFQSLREKVAKEQLEATTDNTLKAEQNKVIKEAEGIKEDILAGKFKEPEGVDIEKAEKEIIDQDRDLTDAGEQLSEDQQLLQTAIENGEIKDVMYVSMANEAVKTPEAAKELIDMARSQAIGQVSGELGNAREGIEKSFGKTIADAVAPIQSQPESGVSVMLPEEVKKPSTTEIKTDEQVTPQGVESIEQVTTEELNEYETVAQNIFNETQESVKTKLQSLRGRIKSAIEAGIKKWGSRKGYHGEEFGGQSEMEIDIPDFSSKSANKGKPDFEKDRGEYRNLTNQARQISDIVNDLGKDLSGESTGKLTKRLASISFNFDANTDAIKSLDAKEAEGIINELKSREVKVDPDAIFSMYEKADASPAQIQQMKNNIAEITSIINNKGLGIKKAALPQSTTETKPRTEEPSTEPIEEAKTETVTEPGKPPVEPPKPPKTEAEGKEAENELDYLANNVADTGKVAEYMSKGTIEKYTDETPTNDQSRGVQELSIALEHGEKIIDKAKEVFGNDYVEKTLDYIEDSKAAVSNKALMYVSLENALGREKLANPDKAADITKQQALVYEKSQAFASQNSLALNYQKLRRVAKVGYDLSKVTDNFFSSKEIEDRGEILKAVEAKPEEINEEFARQETGSITPEVEKMINEGVEKEVAKIYEQLPKEKKSAADRAIAAIEKAQAKIRNKTYDAGLGVPVAIIDMGLTTIKLAIKAGVTTARAIEMGISKIKEKYGKDWAKEGEFRNDMNDVFKSSNEDAKRAKKEYRMLESERNRQLRIVADLTDKLKALEAGERPESQERKKGDTPEINDLRKKIAEEKRKLDKAEAEQKRVEKLEKELQDLKDKLPPGKKETKTKEISDKEKELREKIKDEKRVNREYVKTALIEQGFSREIKVKETQADGTKKEVTKKILDWKKLAGAAGTVSKISENVGKALEKDGFTEAQLDAIKEDFIQQYVDLRASVIEKAQNEIAKRNKEPITPEQKTAAKKIAELYTYGLFDKNPEEFENLINRSFGAKISQEGFTEAKGIAKALENIYTQTFKGVKLNDISAKYAIEAVENRVRILLNKEARKQGNNNLKVANMTRAFFDLSQTMLLNNMKQAFENPLSGLQQNLMEKLGTNISGTGTKELAKQRGKIMRTIYKDMVVKGGIGYGKVENQFVNRQHIDDWVNKMSDNQMFHGIMSVATGKATLHANDAMNKAGLTERKFTGNLIKILTSETNPNRMSKEDAVKFVSEKLTGQNFKDAQKTATDIIGQINEDAGQVIVPNTKESVDRLANDIVKSSLEMGYKITPEQIAAAWNAAYKGAGLGLGHEANNPLSSMVKGRSAQLESNINNALRDKDWNKAAAEIYESMLFRNILNPFVGGGTNWIVLKLEKTGLGLFTGLYYTVKDRKSSRIDVSTKEGMKNLEKSLFQQSRAKDSLMRGVIGGSVTLAAYMAFLGIASTDEYEKWRKKNPWAARYLDIITPEYILADMAANDPKDFKKYLANTLNKNEAFDKAGMLIKAGYHFVKGEPGKAWGKMGEATGAIFNAPVPWRLVKDGQVIYQGVTGQDPYHGDYRPSNGFLSGLLRGGMIEWLGLRPVSDTEPSSAPIKIYDGTTLKSRDATKEEMVKYDKKKDEITEQILEEYRQSGVPIDIFGEVTTDEKNVQEVKPFKDATEDEIKKLKGIISRTASERARAELQMFTKEQALE